MFARQLDERTIAVTLLAGGIVVGLMLPQLSEFLAPHALPALFLVILFSLVPFATLTRTELFTVDPTVWRMVLSQQVVLPCIVIAFGILARFPDYVVSLMIVTSCAGSLFASPALAGLLNLDQRRALQCMVLSTFLMPASLYVFLSLFHGANVHLNLGEYLQRAVIFLVVPFCLFTLYRYISGFLPRVAGQTIANASRWGSILALLIFGIGIMHAVAEHAQSNPGKLAFYLVLATILSIGMLIVTTIVMNRYGFKEALTAGILCGFRNVGLGLALVGDMIGSELAPYVGVSMLPIFIAPFVIRMMTLSSPRLDLSRA